MNRLMPRHRRRWVAGAVLALMGLAGVGLAAQERTQPAGGEFKIRRSTIDGGGAASIGDAFFLQGTVGQPDAGGSSGGEFTLRGGFWTPAGQSDILFKDGFESSGLSS